MDDDKYIYVFVRQDIPLPQQLVHACHAAYHIASGQPKLQGMPSLVVIGVPHPRSLGKVVRKMAEHQIWHYLWTDPDTDYGPTALATYPLTVEQKTAMVDYRLWKYTPAGPGKPACGTNADPGTNALVAQVKSTQFLTERSLVDKPAEGSN